MLYNKWVDTTKIRLKGPKGQFSLYYTTPRPSTLHYKYMSINIGS